MIIVYLLYFIYITGLVLSLLLKIFVINPWIKIMELKKVHGNDVYIYFYPLNGAYRIPYTRRKIITDRPKCKAIVSNHCNLFMKKIKIYNL